jgi:hypothetical protein
MRFRHLCAFALGFSAMVSVAGGQSLNVDLDAPTAGPALGGGVPDSTFGAASGQIGVWNSYAATVGPVGLVGLAGEFTSATLSIPASSTTVSTLAFNNAANSGSFARLVNDAQQIGTTTQGGTRSFTFAGLIDGPYDVYTYGTPPQGIAGQLFVDITGSPQGQLLTSGIHAANTFALGTTHVVHSVNVTGGTFTISVSDVAGSPSAYVNGFQLVLVPEPASAALITAGGCGLLRRRRPRQGRRGRK